MSICPRCQSGRVGLLRREGSLFPARLACLDCWYQWPVPPGNEPLWRWRPEDDSEEEPRPAGR